MKDTVLIFQQQYFPEWELEPMCLNCKLVLCEKRHDAFMVLDNKNTLLHELVCNIARVGMVIFQEPKASVNTIMLLCFPCEKHLRFCHF